MIRALACLAVTLAIAGAMPRAHAEFTTKHGTTILDGKEVPNSVVAQVDCGTGPDVVTRRPFAGGVVFAWKCPGNHANGMQALIYADAPDGRGARLLRFPRPLGREPSEELSNVRWRPATRELTELFIDPESDVFCRTEGRWQLTGTPPMPQLVFWRETRDCDGKSGWKTVVGGQ